jgi:AsmA protein
MTHAVNPDSTMSRAAKWIGWTVIALVLLIPAVVVLVDANHFRGTLSRVVTEKTGRELAIKGDLQWNLDWPRIHLHAVDVTFANPAWAQEKLMIDAPGAFVSVDLPRLFAGTVFLVEVELERAAVFFEVAADGRRTGCSTGNNATKARAPRSAVCTARRSRPLRRPDRRHLDCRRNIDAGDTLGHPRRERSRRPFRSNWKIPGTPPFREGHGRYAPRNAGRKHTVPADGSGNRRAYDVAFARHRRGRVGKTGARRDFCIARGEPRRALRRARPAPPGDAGVHHLRHLTHDGIEWRYQKFTGRIGRSDVAGSLVFTEGPARPLAKGEMMFSTLDLADLGPVVGKNAAGESASLRGRKAPEPKGGQRRARCLRARSTAIAGPT